MRYRPKCRSVEPIGDDFNSLPRGSAHPVWLRRACKRRRWSDCSSISSGIVGPLEVWSSILAPTSLLEYRNQLEAVSYRSLGNGRNWRALTRFVRRPQGDAATAGRAAYHLHSVPRLIALVAWLQRFAVPSFALRALGPVAWQGARPQVSMRAFRSLTARSIPPLIRDTFERMH